MAATTGENPVIKFDFFGTFEMTVDKSQRVAIPSKIMEALAKTFPNHPSELRAMITNDLDEIPEGDNREPIPYVELFPIPVHQQHMANLRQSGINLRLLNGLMEPVEFDASKRLTLSARMISHLGINPGAKDGRTDQAVFVGNTDSILVYSVPNHERREKLQLEMLRKIKAVMQPGAYIYAQKSQSGD